MVTVIDMTTGELIHSSKPMTAKAQTSVSKREVFSFPSLGLQEVPQERRKVQMPPALAEYSVSDFLASFD